MFVLQPAKKRRVAGLPGYQPEYDGDEMKTRPIINKMKMDGATPEMMESTFAARRHSVMNNASVARLKRDYPGLFCKEEVSSPFIQRVYGRGANRDLSSHYLIVNGIANGHCLWSLLFALFIILALFRMPPPTIRYTVQ